MGENRVTNRGKRYYDVLRRGVELMCDCCGHSSSDRGAVDWLGQAGRPDGANRQGLSSGFGVMAAVGRGVAAAADQLGRRAREASD